MSVKETIDITLSPLAMKKALRPTNSIRPIPIKNPSGKTNSNLGIDISHDNKLSPKLKLQNEFPKLLMKKLETLTNENLSLDLSLCGNSPVKADTEDEMNFKSPEKIRKRRKRRPKTAVKTSSPTPKASNLKPKYPNGSCLEKLTQCSNSGTQSQFATTKPKSNQHTPAFAKMLSKHQELRSAVELSRQCFKEYKVSNFFCFDSEFIRAYGEELSKMENTVKTLGTILEKAQSKQHVLNTGIPPVPSPEEEDIIIYSPMAADKSELGSLTPPSSEVGTEDKEDLFVGTKLPKKRRLSLNSEMEETKGNNTGRVTRKKKKFPVSIPVATKIVSENADVQLEASGNETKCSVNASDSNSDSPTKDGEFEVRKIQDYVRKPNGSFYRVSWRGYESDEDTHEPVEHLDGCDELLIDFFHHRLKEREDITTAEQLRSLVLPNETRVKELLFKAFERLVNQPISKETMEKGVRVVTSAKAPAFQSIQEIMDDILKFATLRDPTLDRYKKFYTSIIEQISFRELYTKRQKQLADLRAWERSMNIISSDPAPLTVENNVDLALPPLDFIYINEYVPAPGIIIPSDPVAGCECKECNSIQKGCCASQMGSYFAYNKNGRLRISLGTPIYECNKACKCPPECPNRVVQNGRKSPLAIFRTSNGRGWGVKALEYIKKDQFVTEYVGEVISSEEAELRGAKYDTKGCTYLFDLDYNKGDSNPYTVDAVKYGNVSHFINHSCDPNLVVYNVWVNCLDPDLPKLALFAARDIRKGEEISFDYNSGSTRQISIVDKIDEQEVPLPVSPTKRVDDDGSTIIPTTEFVRKMPRNRVLNAGKTECKCGAANCRKYFF